MKYSLLFLVILFFACNTDSNDVSIPKRDIDTKIEETNTETVSPTVEPEEVSKEKNKPEIDKPTPSTPPPTPTREPETVSHSTSNVYPWKDETSINSSLINRFSLPDGYERIAYKNGSFADWLRHLPLKEKNSVVKYYNGGTKPNQVHEAVLDIDVGTRDLQQCADAVMRLKAEYHYSKKDYKNIHFNYTSGDKVSFDDWRMGKRPIVKGNSVIFSRPTNQTNHSYSNFKKYMIQIFNYAGTASLEKELKRVDVNDIQPGDVFIQGGFPGHAVIVVDVAKNQKGQKIFMIAQSYMPAQDIHILKNLKQSAMSPWYSTDFGNVLNTPEWSFERKNLKRFTSN